MGDVDSAVLTVDGVQTRFGEKYVHQGVSFSLRPGTINALIGSSGTGKSVLLREITGLLRPTGGRILLFGQDVWKVAADTLSKMRTRFGMLFQDGALFSSLNVGENVAVPICEQMKLDEDLVDSLVELRLIMSGLSPDTKFKMPSELSGGMRKRAALARALALEPELLFLDEPTSGLDPITARHFDALIKTLCSSLGITVLLTTHDLDTISGIVDNLIVLGDGRTIADGPVHVVQKNPDRWIQDYFSSRIS